MTKDELKEFQGAKPPDTKEVLEQFVLWRIQQYTTHKFTTLSDVFADDFAQYVREDFEALDKDVITSLRDCLRANGAYVKKGRGLSMAKELAYVIQEEVPWPPDDEDRPPPKTSHYYPQQQRPLGQPLGQAPPLPPQPPVQTENTGQILPLPAQNYGPNYRTPHLLPSPYQVIQEFGTRQVHGHSKELATLAKMYNNDDKYGGSPTESLSYKFNIFMDLCTRAEIPQGLLHTAFPTMLTSMALEYYYSSCQGVSLTTEQLFERFQSHFEGEEHRRNMLREWNNINLRGLLRASPDKNKGIIFNEMILKLRQIQRGLDYEFQSDTALRNKIVTSCSNIPACTVAILQQTPTIAGLINNIYTAIENHEEAIKAERSEPLVPGTFFTDRKYYTNRPPNYSNNGKSSPKPSPSTYDSSKKCFVCGRTGCWSTKHTKEERQESRNKFAKRFTGPINKRYDSYLQEYEGEENDITEDLEALTLDMEENLEEAENFITTTTTFTPNQAISLYSELSSQATYHTLTKSSSFLTTTRYNSTQFQGIMLDTGASRTSTAGYNQAKAFMREFNTQLDTSARSVTARFGIGSAESVGKLSVDSPVGHVDFHVMQADTPFLLCIQDMDRLGIYLNNLKDQVVLRDGSTVPIIRLHGHPFLIWGPPSINYLTDTELRQLHRRFGHPSANRLVRTLEKAGYNGPEHRTVLQRITEFCEFCQKHSRSPGRFKFTLKDEDNAYFNHTIVIDVFYIDGSPILQVVDEGTSFQAARWLANMSASHTWDMLRLCWIDVYVGPPDVIVHDAGTNFDSTEFRQNARAMSIQTKCVPVEAANSIGLVERYHAPLRRAYLIITVELEHQATKEIRLQMAVKAVNDTAGYNGLVPTLLVFGTFPRITNDDAPTLSTTERAKAISMAMAEVSKLHATRQVSDALHQRNGPHTMRMHDTPIGSPVLVWRTHQKKWTGPYKLLATSRETCTIELPNGPTDFRITIVKPYLENSEEIDSSIEPPAQESPETQAQNPEIIRPNSDNSQKSPEDSPEDTPHRRNPTRDRQLPTRFQHMADITVYITRPGPSVNFQASRQKELNGLLEKGVFEIMNTVPIGTRIFGSRFVDQVKNEGTEKAFEKSRLVVQAFNDSEKHGILIQAPTIQRASQRLIIALSLIIPKVSLYLRDITQAYTQSRSELTRNVFILAPVEMGLRVGTILRVILPLYGIAESGTHWFQTYHKHHVEKLEMTPSTFDTCLLFNNNAIVGLQTDDSLIAGTTEFMEVESRQLHAAGLVAKPCEKLTPEQPLDFNGFIITLGDSIKISQQKQAKNIILLPKSFTKEQYVAQRARGAYIATVSQPQAAFALSYAAQITEPTNEDAQYLNRCLSWQLEAKGLTFVKLDTRTLRIVAFTDSSFANNKDLSSQIGYVIVLADAQNNANIIHWQSIKCRRVTRSVLASELYALSLGFDVAATIKSTLDQIFSARSQGKIPLSMCIDSKSLYECLVKLGTTQEKRLMIDILCLRQSYERREITEILWIRGDKNPADSMTKDKGCDALQRLVDTNHLDLDLEGWVERQNPDTDQ